MDLDDDVSDIQREIALLSELRYSEAQNITRYYGSFLVGTKIWIIMDYAEGGSIRNLVSSFFHNHQLMEMVLDDTRDYSREVYSCYCQGSQSGIGFSTSKWNYSS